VLVLTTEWPVTVTAEVAVKKERSRGVKALSLLEMGKDSRNPPAKMRATNPKNRIKGEENIRWGRRLGRA
jgi:hypothetical protein